jgi:lauroyl/myristoyl acyltransferase
LLPAAARFLPDGRQRVTIGAPLDLERRGRLRDDVERVTRDLVHHFEEQIAAVPDQWLVMQPVWTDDVDARSLGGSR